MLAEDYQLYLSNSFFGAQYTVPFLDKDDVGELLSHVQKRIKSFAFSPSSLNSFLDCPTRFFYECLIQVPGPPVPAMEFGSAVHHSLELYFKKMQLHPEKLFPELETLLADFEQSMERRRSFFSEEEFVLRHNRGRLVLESYHQHYSNRFHKIVSIEKFITGVKVQGVPIRGKIDKLEFDGFNVRIVDYKTGSHSYIHKHLHPPCNELPNGGNYWRQAVFYKILVDNMPNRWRGTVVEFDFVEPAGDEFVKVEFVPSMQDVTTVTQQILQSDELVRKAQVFAGCGHPQCACCQVALHDAVFHQLKQKFEE